MKDYLILKDFKGSQDGLGDGEAFVAGTTAPLSDSLAQALGGVAGGFIREAEVAAAEIARAPAKLAEAVKEAIAEADPAEPPADPETESDETPVNPADLRETKVVEPEATKPAKPAAKKKK